MISECDFSPDFPINPTFLREFGSLGDCWISNCKWMGSGRRFLITRGNDCRSNFNTMSSAAARERIGRDASVPRKNLADSFPLTWTFYPAGSPRSPGSSYSYSQSPYFLGRTTVLDFNLIHFCCRSREVTAPMPLGNYLRRGESLARGGREGGRERGLETAARPNLK